MWGSYEGEYGKFDKLLMQEYNNHRSYKHNFIKKGIFINEA